MKKTPLEQYLESDSEERNEDYRMRYYIHYDLMGPTLKELKFVQKELLSFKKRCLEAFDVNAEDLKNYSDNFIIQINLKKRSVYLNYSQQVINEWVEAFHITKRPCAIHGISKNDAFEYYNNSGTSSYSFTDNKDLLDEIIKSIKNGDYKILGSEDDIYRRLCNMY